MHLIVIADSELSLARYSLDQIMLYIIDPCTKIKGLQMHIVTNDVTYDLKNYNSGSNNVQIIPFKDAKQIMDYNQKAIVVHFGKTIPTLKSLPHFFIPIITPNEILNISIIKRFILNQKFKNWVKKAKQVIGLHNLPFVEPNSFEWSALSAAKESLTNGDNFILVFASFENITTILKEFSIFKKWQQSTMHLVFILDNQHVVEKAKSIIKGYKFKEDISMYAMYDINNAWLAASYLTIFERIQDANTPIIFNSIHYGVPLLFDDKIQMPDLWESVGEQVSFIEKNALSNHFKLYYKDEMYRQNRAKLGSDCLQLIFQNRGSFELFNNIVLSHIN